MNCSNNSSHAQKGDVQASVDAANASRQSGEAIHATVQSFAELTRKLLEYEFLSVVFTGSEKDKLRLAVTAGFTQEQEHHWLTMVENLFLHDALDPSTLSRLHMGEVLQLDQDQPLTHIMNPTNIQKVMIAPLHLQEHFIGMLILHPTSAERKHPLEEEKAVIGSIGKLASLIIECEQFKNGRDEDRVNALSLHITDQRMNDFLSLVGHELRTPLTAMKSNIWLATNLLTDVLQHVQGEKTSSRSIVEEVQELLHHVDQLVGVQNRLVSELLDVSRIQANQLGLLLYPHNLAIIVQQAVESLSSVASTNRLRVVGVDGVRMPILVDAERIRRVITNYVTNALAYSAAERPVDIKLQAQGQHARVSVHDFGPGLTLEEQEHVWERFYRVPRVVTQANSRGGLGLGLYICKIIIELHQGQVGVESVLTEGSTFWFTLPLVEQATHTS